MGFDFASPAMLFGGLLFTVPLLIHLLNRRRYTVRAWAAMSFLLAAYKKRKRRLRFENILLLMVRCLIVILLAMAMARPFATSGSALAAISQERRNVVLVLDNSYSMGYKSDFGISGSAKDAGDANQTCFERALSGAIDLIRRLDGSRGDTVSVIVMGEVIEFPVPLNSIPDEALVKMNGIKGPSPRAADFPALAALLAGEVTEKAGGEIEVYIFTDMQARLFGVPTAGPKAGTSALIAKAIERGARIRFVDVSDAEGTRPNLSVTQIASLDPNISTVTPAMFDVTVSNYGEEDLEGVTGTFMLDGKPAEKRIFNVRGQGRTAVELMASFRESGFHILSFRLERDGLPIDNERFFAFQVRDTIDVLLVDGTFDYDPYKSATGLLGMMLNPARIGGGTDGGEKGTIFNPVTVDAKSFNAGRESPGLYDCVILADVEGLSAAGAGALFDYLSSGGRLVLFMGERVDPGAWNFRLFDDETVRILPARLDNVVGTDGSDGAASFFRLTAPGFDHPVLRLFDDPKLKVLLDVPVFRFMATGETAEGADIVAWFSDALGERRPAIVESAVGSGRVMLFTTSADPSWTLIPESPKTFLPLIHETLHYLTAHDPGRYNLGLGGAIIRSVVEFPDRIALAGPGGEVRTVSEPVERKEFGRYLLPLGHLPLDRPGAYTLNVDSSVSGKRLRDCYTANVDPMEGDLNKADPSVLQGLFPGVEILRSDGVPDDEEENHGGGGGDLWKTLLWAVLGFVAIELFLSWKFGDYN